ncbi:DUF7394 family protein [Cytobacillus gottheilii]|uniref:DUF7394 family protein n=1 Tax=Cytobacillus gottheilii TaxID=859144 RepID=UPI0009BAECAF|nr:hypothetical protein [Cytobacillus gottheilii]
MITSLFIIGSAIKIAAVCGAGIAGSEMLKFLHEFNPKTKKKGDKNDDIGQLLREKSKELS